MTTPPPPQAPSNGVSSARLSALDLAVKTVEGRDGERDPDWMANIVLHIADRYRQFLEGETA